MRGFLGSQIYVIADMLAEVTQYKLNFFPSRLRYQFDVRIQWFQIIIILIPFYSSSNDLSYPVCLNVFWIVALWIMENVSALLIIFVLLLLKRGIILVYEKKFLCSPFVQWTLKIDKLDEFLSALELFYRVSRWNEPHLWLSANTRW